MPMASTAMAASSHRYVNPPSCRRDECSPARIWRPVAALARRSAMKVVHGAAHEHWHPGVAAIRHRVDRQLAQVVFGHKLGKVGRVARAIGAELVDGCANGLE